SIFGWKINPSAIFAKPSVGTSAAWAVDSQPSRFASRPLTPSSSGLDFFFASAARGVGLTEKQIEKKFLALLGQTLPAARTIKLNAVTSPRGWPDQLV